MTTNDGTQAIRRAAAILQKIAGSASEGGPTLGEVATSLDISRSTAHRMLKCLVDVGLASYGGASRRYEIGPLTYELGLAVPWDVLEPTNWRRAVDRIALRTGATAYLMRRSGIEAVCVHKAEGAALIRVIPVEVGQRRLLGVGTGATALLAALDAATIKRLATIISPGLSRYDNLTPETVYEIVAAAQATGVAVGRGNVFRSVVGLGIAVPRAGGPPVLALSIAAYASGVDEGCIADWTKVLVEELEAGLKEIRTSD